VFFVAVKISDLKVSQSERQVREYLNTPQGAIEVYEPTLEDIQKIIDMQKAEDMENGVVLFDGVQVIRELFPMLTNIDLGDLTDEQLEEVIENPSIHLLTAQQFVAQIVAEANKLYAERVKTELMNAESTMAQMELISTIPTTIIENAKKEGKIGELVEKVEKASKELDEAIKRETEDNE
jgi:uncharacterized radical SAM superfamily Fe-S cluster-containing enzyme